jgi:dsDNA-specific endonuclease/ATPase MutS2
LSAQGLKEEKDWRDMSGEEWDKMLEDVDNYIDAFKEQMREMKEKQDEAAQKAALEADSDMKTIASSSAALAVANGFDSGTSVKDSESEDGADHEKNWTKKLKTDDQTILMTAKEAQRMERNAASRLQEIQLDGVTAMKASADYVISKYMRNMDDYDMV